MTDPQPCRLGHRHFIFVGGILLTPYEYRLRKRAARDLIKAERARARRTRRTGK